ncbi:MAG: hypothetical protein KDK00_09485 [Rhodobacteraceae bacterium]|nr:hypothetical protein [Paracoccaceae bacterium]
MLKFVVYLMAGGALAGMAVIAALVLGFDDSTGVITAAAIGAAVGLPVAWVVAGKLSDI